MTAKKSIILFVPTDYIGIIVTNALVPALVKSGLNPVLFDTGTAKNRQFKVQAPADLSFYNVGAFDKAVIPFLNTQTPAAGATPAAMTYAQLAQTHGLTHHVIKDVNDDATRTLIDAVPDAIGAVSIRQLQIFESAIIDRFKNIGFFWNIHSGLLPDYKGLLIPYRAIINGEREYGWTLHDIDTHIDTGHIVDTCVSALDVNKPVLDTYLDMAGPAVEMIVRAVQNFPQVKKPNTGGTYYTYPTKEELSVFQRAGITYVASPRAYVDRIIASFSIPGTKHADMLRDAVIQSMAGHFRSLPQTQAEAAEALAASRRRA